MRVAIASLAADSCACEAKKNPSGLQQKPLVPKLLHDAEPVFGPDFVLHAIKMIFDRLFRQAKMIRNLFIRESLRDQRNNLLLTPRQSKPLRRASERHSRFRVLKKSKQGRAKLTGTNRFPRVYVFDSLRQFIGRCIPPQITADSGPNILQEFAVFLRRSDQQDLHRWRVPTYRRDLL